MALSTTNAEEAPECFKSAPRAYQRSVWVLYAKRFARLNPGWMVTKLGSFSYFCCCEKSGCL